MHIFYIFHISDFMKNPCQLIIPSFYCILHNRIIKETNSCWSYYSVVYIFECSGHTDIISIFGFNGNGLYKATRYTSQTNIHILCGTTIRGVQLDWFFSNGTKVGNRNRNIREGHFRNGTASLQIASDRRLSPCDSGMYICKANQTAMNQAQQKTFTLIIDCEL